MITYLICYQEKGKLNFASKATTQDILRKSYNAWSYIIYNYKHMNSSGYILSDNSEILL